ncbi:glycosyltransferase [Treponema sp.]|uniref:glycosyltransferase n=1 Tax=Treponema sp. TaxID=166 RepID=UPI0025E0220A|nr:glycosyltransferase [Treponema sp.]MCR5218119.1 glycosyltransferase [Treponema sp.]
MNIALFTDSYLPTKSGIVTVVVQLRKILEEYGHNVVVITVNCHEIDEDAPEEKNVLRVKSIKTAYGNHQYIGVPSRRKVVAFLREHNVQLIHAHTEFFVGHCATVAGKKLGIPVIATTHTMWEDYYRYYLKLGKIIPKKAIRKIVRILYKRFYALINVSEKARCYFKQPFMLPLTPSAVIPNAIDASRFSQRVCTEEEKAELKKKLGIRDGDRVVLYVGRIVEEKRLAELYEIMRNVIKRQSGIKMLFVGSGAMEEPLREKCQAEGLSSDIIFTGFIDWTELYKYYDICDLFVTASLSEMHSMTILEALISAKPVVCRRDSSFSDTVFDGKDGYFADTDNEMEEKILSLLADRPLMEAMGREAKKVSSSFTLDVHGKRTLAFYELVLKNYPRRVTSEMLRRAVENAVSK